MTVFEAILLKSGSFRLSMLQELKENILSDGRGIVCLDELDSFHEIGVLPLDYCSGDCVRCMKNLLMMEVGEFDGFNFRF